MFEDYPDILSPEEAAEALRIGENAIYKLLIKTEEHGVYRKKQ